MPSIADEIVHTTARIETQSEKGSGSGTGFFFDFCSTETGNVPVLVSNKHVIEGAKTGQIHITLRKSADNAQSEPDLGNHVAVPIDNFESLWVKHPDPDVDLAVFPIAPVLHWLKNAGKDVFYRSLDMGMVANPAYMQQLSAVEDIIMIGYPNGLWDAKHNLPIVRRGGTATPPYVDFDGKPVFMIDCACFPGSSGSPVLLYNVGTYMDKNGGTVMGGTRIRLLGVLYAGPQFTAQGEIKVMPVPTANAPVALSRIPINLGICVKADRLQWFEDHFQTIMEAERRLNAENVGEPTPT